MAVDLVCYVYDGWKPRLRPASQRRDWMDASPEAFAYRCLPLNIANAHGWELLSPCAFEAEWNGGDAPQDVVIRLDDAVAEIDRPVGLFGMGTVTFHVPGLFRTSPGWDLWVGGSPNGAKDGIAPLGGVIETDWSPYTFTMNWRFTRPHHPVRFEMDEPICFFFPIQRGPLEGLQPRVAAIETEPLMKAEFETWSRSRDAFQQAVAAHPPSRPADKWQKLYYRGVGPDESPGPADHRSKLRLKPFDGAARIEPKAARASDAAPRCPVERRGPPAAMPDQALARRNWLLATQQRLRALSRTAEEVPRLTQLSAQEFLDHFYAANRPVVLSGAAADWPAHRLWSPAYLKQKLRGAPVEVQDGRAGDASYERSKEAHRTVMPFDRFIDRLIEEVGNDLYLTAFNAQANKAALAPLHPDLRMLDSILDSADANRYRMPWFGAAGTFTPLHHDLTNNLLVQITGRKQIVLVSPAETPRLYNDQHVFSQVQDITAPDLDQTRFPLLDGVRFQQLTLAPGDALFIPVGWWHQVRSLDFSVSITYTNFLWPNDFSAGFDG